LSALVEDPDVEWLFIDGSYVKAHQVWEELDSWAEQQAVSLKINISLF